MVARNDSLGSFGSFDIVRSEGGYNPELAESIKNAGFGVKQVLSQNFDMQSGMRDAPATPQPSQAPAPAAKQAFTYGG